MTSATFGGLDMITLGKKLKALREAKNYSTLREFSRESGINRGSVNDIEKGRNYPSFKTFEKWLNACGVSADEFFRDERFKVE